MQTCVTFLQTNLQSHRVAIPTTGSLTRGSVMKLNMLNTKTTTVVSTFFNLLEPCVLYIGPAYRYPPDVPLYIFFFPKNISTEYFKHAAHSPFFSSKCRLFHNATFFWFLYYSHFTYRVC